MVIKVNKSNILTSIWDKVDNKKTLIGITLYFVYQILVSEGLVVEDPSVHLFINGIIGVGVGHKAQKLINKI